MAENKVDKDAPQDNTVDPAVEAGTNRYGVDLNDQSLKGGTDNKDLQADNEARMNAAAGTDRPVVEQIREANEVETLVVAEDDGTTAPADDKKK